MQNDSQLFVDLFKNLANSLDIPDESISDAEPLVKELAAYAGSLFKKGTAFNIFFSDHGASHSENMLNILLQYFNKLTRSRIPLPLDKDERLPFLMFIYSSVLLHDIYMSVMQDEDWNLTLKKINVEQLHRDDHVIKSVVFLLQEFHESKFPSTLWIEFWKKLKGFKHVKYDNTFLMMLRVCKSHGDGGADWLSDSSLKELRIDDSDLKNLADESYHQKLSDWSKGTEKWAATLKGILDDGVDLLKDYTDSQDSVMKILRSSAGFLCLLDLLDIKDRFNIFNERTEEKVHVLKKDMPKSKLNAFKQHWLADRLVKEEAYPYSDNNLIRWDINVEQVGGEEFSDVVKKFCCHCGATSSAYQYGNDLRLKTALKEWKYGGIDIKVQESFSDGNIIKIYNDIFNFEFGNTESRNYLSEIWRGSGVSEDKEICSRFLIYVMLNSENLFEISKQDELMPGILFVSPFMQAIRKGVPLDSFVELLTSENTEFTYKETTANTYIVRADSYYVSFLGGLNLARHIFTRNPYEGKIKWVRKTNRTYNLLAERGTDLRDRNIYLVYCPNKDIVYRIEEIAARRSNATFVLFGLSELTDCNPQTIRVKALFPDGKIPVLCESLKKLAGYIFEKEFEQEFEQKLKTVDCQSPDELLQSIMFVVSGAAGDVDRIVAGFAGGNIGPYLLTVIISIYAKNENSDSGDTITKAQKSLVKRCFKELTEFVFYKKISPLDLFVDCDFDQAFGYFANILNDDGEYLTLKDDIDMNAIVKNIKKQIESTKEKKYLMRIVELHTILWARDLSRLNVRSIFLDDFEHSLMCALPVKSIVTFVLGNRLPIKDIRFDKSWQCDDSAYIARLCSRNEIVCAALHAIWFMDTLPSDREFFINDTAYIELLINELLQKCNDLEYDYDLIVFQALYRMIESLMNFYSPDNTGESNKAIGALISNLREKFILTDKPRSLVFCLADLEAMCSSRKESLVDKIKENVEMIIKASDNGNLSPNIYQFAFDIVFHYGKYADSHIDSIWEQCNGLFPVKDREEFTAASNGIRDVSGESPYISSPFYRLKRVFNLVHESFTPGLPTRMHKRIERQEK